MKLKKWCIKTLTALNAMSLIFLCSIADFELCLSAIAAIIGILAVFAVSSLLLLKYGGID